MTQYIAYAVGLLGLLFGARCYLELWRWAKHCQRAKIAIAYNRRVQLEAPLTEWLQWANALGKDQKTRGRVVYKAGKVSVAVLRPDVKNETKTTIKSVRSRGRRREQVPT